MDQSRIHDADIAGAIIDDDGSYHYLTIPIMPDDFWPQVIVTGKIEDGDAVRCLSFAITEEGKEHIKDTIVAKLEALRYALWQARYLKD